MENSSYNNNNWTHSSMEDYSRNGRSRIVHRDTSQAIRPSYSEIVEENKLLAAKVKELDRQLILAQATVERTKENFAGAMANCDRLEKENNLLKKAVSSNSSVGSTDRKDEEPRGFNAAMARLEAKINIKKRDQKMPLSVDQKNKLDVLEVKLKEEQLKNEELQERNKRLTDKLDDFRAVVSCYKKKFKSAVKAAEGEMIFMEGLASALLEKEGEDPAIPAAATDENLSETETVCSHVSSSSVLTSVSRVKNKNLPPPPAIMMDAINMISHEELEELQRMSMFGLDQQ